MLVEEALQITDDDLAEMDGRGAVPASGGGHGPQCAARRLRCGCAAREVQDRGVVPGEGVTLIAAHRG